MAITEEDILREIKAAEVEQKEARALVAYHKKAAVDAETRLIEVNLFMEGLVEKLRVWRKTTVSQELTEREKDIEAFRLKLPELLKKIS